MNSQSGYDVRFRFEDATKLQCNKRLNLTSLTALFKGSDVPNPGSSLSP